MSSFPDVKSAVDAVVEILQCGLPMARIGKYTCSWLKKKNRSCFVFSVGALQHSQLSGIPLK